MTPENLKPIFLHYGRHTIRACRLPDGRVFPDFRDALRVLCLIVGAPPAVNRVVDDGNTVRIYKRDTGELLAEKRNCVEN